ncbi:MULTISPECIES: feruloyl-CoA synthase [Burkholderia cepacia complex]|uniref:feruloyl-CoA synthase n=1 Tax=Burkholderia cepacia complex TaxID=87882 RepID=UPI0026DFB672|nr:MULTISPECIES: feruloyl-CoA synthase [Burkholderia cepacia complex]MDO5947036.1 feruloyl-CoA synthase [Burkholderia cepacia]MDS0803627.1 feruloyl-CoA synthase [Burkholderia cenocepacia]
MLTGVHHSSPLARVGALAVPRIVREDRGDGSFVLRSTELLQPYHRRVGEWLIEWARTTPDAVFIAERESGRAGWREVRYASALESVRRIAQGLIDSGLPEGAPIVALSDNSVNLALLSLAAMHVGRPISIVSSAYARVAKDHTKLHAMLDQLSPAMIYAEDGAVYGDAIESYASAARVVYTTNVRPGAMSFAEFEASTATDAVEQAYFAVTPQTPARLLLTSGSTGKPKVVVNTHDMLCANQQMIAQCWRFVDRAQPVVLDWLPWSHTFGANHNFNLILRNGGALYIDDGRPVPGLVERTLRNLKDVRPMLFFNVPKGYDALLPLLERDAEATNALFERLDMLFFAAAALPQKTADRVRELAATVRDEPVFFTTEWGATETSPVITSAHFDTSDSRNIGVPVPGIDLKFVPCQGKLEMRVRGPSVFTTYRDDPERTKEAFDEERFYRIGDAGRLADPTDPNRGVIFDGRVAEDFKLTTGTWVSVGTLRVRVVSALHPYVHDAVITGHDRDEVGLLLFPSPALRALANDHAAEMSGDQLAACIHVRAVLNRALAELCVGMGSSQRPTRALLLSSPPSLEQGEVTDKGYINQRAVLTLRANDVERLYTNHEAIFSVR